MTALLPTYILLAEDDPDDDLLFRDALEALNIPVQITIVSDGEQLMGFFDHTEIIPDIVFLDLNMPKINGLICLKFIKETRKLRHLPVIIFSTSYIPEVIDQLYGFGAHYFIRKPTDFDVLKDVLLQGLSLTTALTTVQPARDQFELL